MSIQKHIIIILLATVLLPGSLLSQTILWDTTYTLSEFGERINDISITSNGDVLCVGRSSPNSNGEPSMLKFDSLGNFKWFKRQQYDSLQNGNFNFIEDVPGEKDFYYVGGSSYELGVWNNDFIAKIDTSGDSLWTKLYHYATFYGTCKNAIVLKDKSIITIGDLLTASDYDIIARRVDSLGKTIWERIYNMPGRQEGYDLTEMLDGSLILAGSNDGDNLIMRIGFDGRLIDTYTFNNTHEVITSHIALVQNNQLIQTGASSTLSSTFKNVNLFKDSSFYLLQSLPQNTLGILVDHDTNAVIPYFFDDSIHIRYSHALSLTNEWDINLGDVNSDFKRPYGMYKTNDGMFIVYGYSEVLNNRDYWLAKISGVGEEWIPDRCAYQPPVAGFDWGYNYPVLTLRDTSSGGLKYLDTVYTWQWNTSVSTSGTDDSLLVFFDTAISKTITVNLVIGNWYGCTDTVNKTLTFEPNGITEYRDLEVKIYPNPVKDILHIELSESIPGKVRFEIFDLRGNKVQEDEFTGTHLSSVVHGLPSSMYFYRITSGTQVKRGKVLKE